MVHLAALRRRNCLEDMGEIPKGAQDLEETGERLLATRLQEGQRAGLQ
ncbi:hypothetical protein HNQ08_002596 [Deinococcus humi]|uniref:Uncharacterized protein n=1 Tax=Deinococcus humi TaxID=662880 RepID=A0A7W8JV28_9DEIO|nr:hypothetical protein [Deinococcus humi]